MLNNLKQRIFPNQSLQARTLKAALWSLAGSSGSGIVRLASNLILTRLLFPEAMGMMATAMVVLTLIQIFSDTGVKTALIQNENGAKPEFVNSALIITLVRSLVLFILLLFAAGPVALFYGEPELVTLLKIMSAALLLEGFQNPALPLVIKTFRVEKQVMFALGSQTAGFITTIALVWSNPNVTSVAVGYLITSLFRVIGSYLVFPYRPKLQWHSEYGRQLLNFGKFIFMNTMITWAVLNLDRLVIGKTLSMEALGIYNIALYIGVFISDALVQTFSQSFFPAVSSVADDFEKVKKIYSRTMGMIIPLVIPVLSLIAIYSDEIIQILYDPRYALAGSVLFWLSLKSIVTVVSSIQSGTLLALGKPQYVTISMFTGLILMGFALPVSSRLYGLNGAGITILIVSTVIAAVQLVYLRYKFSFSLKQILSPWMWAGITGLLILTPYYILSSFNSGVSQLSPGMVSILLLAGVLSSLIAFQSMGTLNFRVFVSKGGA